MRKLLLLSIIIVPIALPIWLSKDSNQQRGRSRTVTGIVVFVVAWALLMSKVFFMFPGDD